MCECGGPEDDEHRIWGACAAREDCETIRKTEGLARRAHVGAKESPAFWLRGITPKKWSTPPKCDTKHIEHTTGASITSDRLCATEGGELTGCGDGSGGEYSADE
eukprot:8301271-Pyramimonas_sp.AAC.1